MENRLTRHAKKYTDPDLLSFLRESPKQVHSQHPHLVIPHLSHQQKKNLKELPQKRKVVFQNPPVFCVESKKTPKHQIPSTRVGLKVICDLGATLPHDR